MLRRKFVWNPAISRTRPTQHFATARGAPRQATSSSRPTRRSHPPLSGASTCQWLQLDTHICSGSSAAAALCLTNCPSTADSPPPSTSTLGHFKGHASMLHIPLSTHHPSPSSLCKHCITAINQRITSPCKNCITAINQWIRRHQTHYPRHTTLHTV